MRNKGLFLMLSCAAVLAVPARAQTDFMTGLAKKGLQLSPALRKKVAGRAAALRADASAPVGPMFDHLAKEWIIDPAACPLVPSPVKGNGFKGHTVWLAMNDDGSFHLQLRTEASGTAVDAGGNKYLWIYTGLAELDTPDPTVDAPVVIGYGHDTFQLFPLTTTGAGYTAADYLQLDTPTPINSVVTPVAANVPPGCEPL